MNKETMRRRPTARVLLLDPGDRLLLMRGRGSHLPDAPTVWWTVGGGARVGETLHETALREIREEAGIEDVELGPVVWRREAVLLMADGAHSLLEESYFVARCAGAEPDRSGWDAHEQALCDDIRWWSPADLPQIADVLFPERMLELLPAILAGDYPAEPLDITVAAPGGLQKP